MILIMNIGKHAWGSHIQYIDWKFYGMTEDDYTSPTIEVDGKKFLNLSLNWMREISLMLV